MTSYKTQCFTVFHTAPLHFPSLSWGNRVGSCLPPVYLPTNWQWIVIQLNYQWLISRQLDEFTESYSFMTNGISANWPRARPGASFLLYCWWWWCFIGWQVADTNYSEGCECSVYLQFKTKPILLDHGSLCPGSKIISGEAGSGSYPTPCL